MVLLVGKIIHLKLHFLVESLIQININKIYGCAYADMFMGFFFLFFDINFIGIFFPYIKFMGNVLVITYLSKKMF